jgi:uncharacterized protein involved in exopolysaccharide biosynthesis
MTDALARVGMLLVAVVGVAIGAFWLFFRPKYYKRGLESSSSRLLKNDVGQYSLFL